LTDTEGVVGLPDVNTDPAAYAAAHQSSANALFNVNGVNFSRSSNTVGDVISGVSLNLKALGGTTIELTRDNSVIKQRFTDLVTAYNEAQSMIKVVSDPKSTVETYGASLVNESYVRTVKEQLRSMLFENSSAWTAGNPVKSLRDLGLSIDVTGTMNLDETVLDAKLTNNFDDLVTSMTGNYNDLGEFSTAPVGIAGTASRRLTKMLKATGDIQKHSNTAQAQVDKYKEDLAKLQARMDTLLIRYQKQFAVMDSMVGQNNALKTSLKSSFEGMSAAYNN
jgi:flagellar hook-associated protein 2